MVKIVGRSLLQGQMGQIFVIGIVGNESDVFVTAQWWCGGVVVWWCGGVVVWWLVVKTLTLLGQ
jgi:hypothetical protein